MLTSLERWADAPSRPQDPRAFRRAAQHRNMWLAGKDFIYSRSELLGLGTDPLLDQMLRAAGFDPLDFVTARFIVHGDRVTAIVLPRRIWREPDAFALALGVKVEASLEGTRCMLIPHRSIDGSTRGRVAAAIGKGRTACYDTRQIDAVLAHVRGAGITTLRDCARAVPSREDPLGVVFAMVARGLLDIDRGHVLDGDSWVAIPV